MTTQPTTSQPPSVEERLSRLEGGYDRIGDLVQLVAGLRTDMNAFRADMNAQFESLRAETNQRIESLRAETNQQIESMRVEMSKNARTTYVLLSTSWLALMLTTVGINFLT
ncbi:MAG: hypothetical protein OXE02_08005 [Chloroflexi bacterium]|nr:hypothetical protein [Chloroflexota bacterium]